MKVAQTEVVLGHHIYLWGCEADKQIDTSPSLASIFGGQLKSSIATNWGKLDDYKNDITFIYISVLH